MTDDIVTRLREVDAVNCMDNDHLFDGLLVDAADEIEKLRCKLRKYTGDHHTINAARRGDPSGVQDPSEGHLE